LKKIHATCELLLTGRGLFAISTMARHGMRPGPGWGLVYHSPTVGRQHLHHTKTFLAMNIKNSKKTIAAFENLEIKTAQQLEVKGGNSDRPKSIIGENDVVVS
jgi:hypothetical protein